MRFYRIAIILGVISAILVSASFFLYLKSSREVKNNRAQLTSIRATNAQYKDYKNKIMALKVQSSKLSGLSRERGTSVDYEIELTDPSLEPLMREISNSYTGFIFFLEHATVESTVEGITVKMKGFKLGAAGPTP